ncbi:MAG: hypothetical protein K9L68_10355 [Spirochaetales bacterium]|nr:hypothetical protein [Spirochaetales bacterium]MCF7938985.1 hypothetical protein [Spirochaetales bacterium]
MKRIQNTKGTGKGIPAGGTTALGRAPAVALAVGLAVSLALSAPAAFADDVSMDATASDQVGTEYSYSEDVTLLGIKNSPSSLNLTWTETASASTPGAEVTQAGSGDSAYGGWLHYTLHSVGTHKITAQVTGLGAQEVYNENSLEVRISNTPGVYGETAINAGGSEKSSLGVFPDSYNDSNFVPLRAESSKTILENIDGTNTWTGTGDTEGAPLEYYLYEDPGSIMGSIEVTYTLMAE